MNRAYQQQLKIPAVYMRGGTSKGVFFKREDLPYDAQQAGPVQDQLLLRLMGSPDPYAKQIDGMGGATSSTSKAVIINKSTRPDHDVDYCFAQVAIDGDLIDLTGNCGNLTAAVGPFAIEQGLIDPERIPENGLCTVRIWQTNIKKTIIAHVPIQQKQVQELGNFELDGVTFPAAEIQLEFLNPADSHDQLFFTGQLVDQLEVPDVGNFTVTLFNAGIATIFINAADLGYSGTELQSDINSDAQALARLEKIRAYGAVKMGLIDTVQDAKSRQHTPKLVLVAPAKTYVSSSGKTVRSEDITLLARAISMGKLHHAMMGTAAVAIAAAAAIPGTLVNRVAGGGNLQQIKFGHPSGLLSVGAQVEQHRAQWVVQKVSMSRSARVLMEGWVRIPPL